MTDRPEFPDFAVEFVATYSRFEYAMKAADYIKPVKDGGDVWPDWKRFKAKPEISTLFGELAKNTTIKRLIDKPTEGQIVVRGTLCFRPCGPATNMDQLIEAVRRTRNNVFHGGKDFGTRAEHDKELIVASTAVLDAMLNAAPDVGVHYAHTY